VAEPLAAMGGLTEFVARFVQERGHREAVVIPLQQQDAAFGEAEHLVAAVGVQVNELQPGVRVAGPARGFVSSIRSGRPSLPFSAPR